MSKPRETLLVWGQDGESASLLKDKLLATCTCMFHAKMCKSTIHVVNVGLVIAVRALLN